MRLFAPLLGWLARRAEASGRAEELLRRYGADEAFLATAVPVLRTARPATAGRA
jgi:membrane protein DedA with SNARE-associated domain